VVTFSQLAYLMQLSYLVKLLNPKDYEFSPGLVIFPVLQWKTVAVLQSVYCGPPFY